MRSYFALLPLVATLTAGAQKRPPVNLYGYMRPSHPGIVPANVPNATLAEYLIYVAHPARGFRLLSVSVGGKPYAFSLQSQKAPVAYENRNLPKTPKKVTLVPATSAAVDQLLLTRAPNRPGAGTLQIKYTLNGKSFTKKLTSWKELEPIMYE